MAYRLDMDEKIALCWSFAQEITQEDELRKLLANKPNPVAYDGFEPSGRMHIAQVRRQVASTAGSNRPTPLSAPQPAKLSPVRSIGSPPAALGTQCASLTCRLRAGCHEGAEREQAG